LSIHGWRTCTSRHLVARRPVHATALFQVEADRHRCAQRSTRLGCRISLPVILTNCAA